MKLLVSDYDGTLSVDIATNLWLVNDFQQRGNYFMIATGRNLSLLQPIIAQYQIACEYILCNDGGVIFDKHEKEIFRNDIASKTAQQLFSLLQQFPIKDLRIDDGYRYYYEIIANVNAIIFTVSEPNRDYELLQLCLAKFSDIKGYMTDNSVVLLDKNTDKANGINYLNQFLQIAPENIYTVGDGINDYEMIEQFQGYCMVNSHHKLTNIANKQISSVAALLKQII